MSRDSTTGIYTRVSNSFSQPVTGTTIDPGDADTFFDDVEAAMNSFIGTSTTSLAIGTGAKTFTTQTGKTFITGTFVQAISQASAANYMYGTVTSYDSMTGALVIDVVTVGGSGTLADWSLFFSGARGGTGAAGAQGNEAGFKYTFNTATSGDPGSGKFLFNNATFASATAMNISETDGDGNALATLFTTLDDSTSTNKCLVMFRKENDTEAFLAYITGTLTDNGAYDTFSITPISALGTMANNDVCRLIPIRTGDKGADGAGTGDVVGPSSSVDSEIALFSSTTGKLIKRASISGLAKLTSGVLSAATAGTDYYNPGGTDVAVADGGTGSSTAAGARTNLSAAALSQTGEFIAGYIKSPANQDYRLVVKIPHGGTITETVTRSESGTCTATFKVNTTALGGTANSVSSSEQAQAQASSNTFVADDDIVVTISSNSSCAGMSFTIKYTRTLL